MKILILNGPNLNLQGRRDVAVYGSTAFEEYLTRLRAVFPDVGLDCFQSNVEGELIDALHRSEGRYDGVVFNAGGYTHTSVALHDALEAAELPVVEVHLSNVHRREQFRHHSFVSPQATAVIAGAGAYGYVMAVDFLAQHLAE